MHYTQEKHVAGVDIEDVYLGNGVSELIVMCLQALLNNGDEVLVPAPDYPLWTAAVSLVGRHAGPLPVRRGAGWLPDLDDIRAEDHADARGRIVVINPNNPTGALYPDDLLREHRRVRPRAPPDRPRRRDLRQDPLRRRARTRRIASLADDVLCLTFNGLSKNYRACGYRAGWMVVSGDKRHAERLHRGPEHPGDDAAVLERAGPARDPDRARRLPEHQGPGAPGGRLRKQRDLAYELLTAIPGVTCVKPKAALYLFPRLDPTVYPIDDDQQFVLDLLAEEKLLVVQGTGFNWPTPDHFRIVFLPNADDLTEAIGRIERFLDHYRKTPQQP